MEFKSSLIIQYSIIWVRGVPLGNLMRIKNVKASVRARILRHIPIIRIRFPSGTPHTQILSNRYGEPIKNTQWFVSFMILKFLLLREAVLYWVTNIVIKFSEVNGSPIYQFKALINHCNRPKRNWSFSLSLVLFLKSFWWLPVQARWSYNHKIMEA